MRCTCKRRAPASAKMTDRKDERSLYQSRSMQEKADDLEATKAGGAIRSRGSFELAQQQVNIAGFPRIPWFHLETFQAGAGANEGCVCPGSRIVSARGLAEYELPRVARRPSRGRPGRPPTRRLVLLPLSPRHLDSEPPRLLRRPHGEAGPSHRGEVPRPTDVSEKEEVAALLEGGPIGKRARLEGEAKDVGDEFGGKRRGRRRRRGRRLRHRRVSEAARRACEDGGIEG